MGRGRRGGKGGPQGIGDILDGLVGRGGKRRAKFIDRVRRKWAEVAGAEIGARTSVVSLRGSVLHVRVSSNVLLAELDGIYKSDLIAALAEGDDVVAVRTIRFELSGGQEIGG